MKRYGLTLAVCVVLLLAACTLRPGNSAQTDEPTHAAGERSAAVSAEQPGSENAPADREDLPETYRELVADKATLVGLVAERVDVYRNGGEAALGSGHMAYPADCPPAEDLPEIHGVDGFAVRCNRDLDSLEAIYIAVPIGDGCELRMAFSRQDLDGETSWGSGWTWFARVQDIPWWEQDIDLYP